MSSPSPRRPAPHHGRWRVLEAAAAERIVRAAFVTSPYLVIPLADGRSLVATLDGDDVRLTIGRSREADLPIGWDATASSSHAVVERQLDMITIEERVPSTNGTFINEERILCLTRLADRDLVRCGSTDIIVRCPVVDEGAGTVALPSAPNWQSLTRAEVRLIVLLIEEWPPENRLQRAPSNLQLAEHLQVAESTVRSQFKSIFRKLAPTDLEAKRTWLAEVATKHESALRRRATESLG